MSTKQGTVQYVKKINYKKILLIILILAALFAMGKLSNFFGKFTGEVADDGNTFNKYTEAWNGTSFPIVLPKSQLEVLISDINTLNFSSDSTDQTLNIGNPSENRYDMNFVLRVADKDIYSSGILKPGQGINITDLKAYFKPNQYDANFIYTFYHLDGSKLKVMEVFEQPVKLNVTGSLEHFKGKEARLKTGS